MTPSGLKEPFIIVGANVNKLYISTDQNNQQTTQLIDIKYNYINGIHTT